MNTMPHTYKQPISVLVILYDECGKILLLERADRPGFWQSVTGSLEHGELPRHTAMREVREETGITLRECDLTDWHQTVTYEIYEHWRHRYAPGVTCNTEHIFSAIIPRHCQVYINPREHIAFGWYDLKEASDKVFSPSNKEALLNLPQYWSLASTHLSETSYL